MRDRDPFIDFLRVASVLVVVLGHWTATSVRWDDTGIIGDNALAAIPESHPATWLFQVMPLLFFIGGFANARSLARHSTYLDFLKTRLRRLLNPTLVFVAVWLVVGVAAELLPLPHPNLVDRGADIAALPFWFVGLYVVVVAVAPAMLRLHRRWGWRVPAVLTLGVVAVDVLTYPLDLAGFGVANYAFVWLLPHQLGFFYDDSKKVGSSQLWGVAAGGLTTLILLTSVGEYPVSMIFVPGADRGNTEPPSLAIVAVSAVLISVALIARPWIERRRDGWISRLNEVPLSMYLWHVSAIPIAVAVLYPLGFPQHPIGSSGWWLWRPVWLLALSGALAVIVMAVARFEIHPDPATLDVEPDRRRIPLALLGVVIVAVALLGFGVTGFNRPLAATGEGLLGFTMNPLLNTVHLAVGLTVLLVIFRARRAFLSTAAVAGSVLLTIGLVGLDEGLAAFGSNPATSTVDLVLGGALVVAAVSWPAKESATK